MKLYISAYMTLKICIYTYNLKKIVVSIKMVVAAVRVAATG